MTTDTVPELGSIEPNQHGYRTFTLGKFTFSRDQYFVHVRWPNGTHMLPADAFLRAIQRDVAWGFFYGIVNFDTVIGTVNHYGTVDLFAGRFNAQYRQAGLDYSENLKSDAISKPSFRGKSVSRRKFTIDCTGLWSSRKLKSF